MGYCTIDFETYSECDLRDSGMWRYAEDPTTEVMCIKYKLPSGFIGSWDTFYPDLNDRSDLDPLFSWIKAGGLVEAHNAGFEEAIWTNVMVKKYGFPEVPANQWRCSAAKAAAMGLPRALGQLGTALGTSIQKDEAGRRVMLKMSKPRKPTKNDPSTRHDKPEDIETLLSYCTDDILTEEACSDMIPDLPAREFKIWTLDQSINRLGLPVDVPNIKRAISYIARFSKTLVEELIEITDGVIKSPGQHAKIKAFCHDNGYAIEGTAKPFVEAALEDETIPDLVRRVLEIRQALGSAAVKKYKKMLAMTCENGRIKGTLLYYGASTGRWSGSGIQPQNLPRGSVKDVDTCIQKLETVTYKEFITAYPDVMGALASCIRGMIKAEEGKTFYCADYSSIESRALFWLADCESGLEIYRKDGKVYEDMAATIYGVPVSQIKGGSVERQVGKQAILGLGYGMGKVTFKATCEGYKIEVSDELADKAVNAYRTKYAEIKKLWKDCEVSAIKAVKSPGVVVRQSSKLAWRYNGKFLQVRLPSGRKISYYKPAITMARTSWGELKETLTYMHLDSTTKKYRRTKTYGGKLVENVTQGLARDLMAESMLNVDAAGYDIVLTVHDELLAEAREGFGSLKDFESIMEAPPKWALDMPIEVEGWQGKRFKK